MSNNYLNADWVRQEIAVAGSLTVKQIVELSGKSDTTVRKVVKELAANGWVKPVVGSKPMAYELDAPDVTPVDESEENISFDTDTPDVDTDAADVEVIDVDADIDGEVEEEPEPEVVEAAPVKPKRNKKMSLTDIDDDHDVKVLVNSEWVSVATAFAAMEIDGPLFNTYDDLVAVADASEGVEEHDTDYTPEEIAAHYYLAVHRQLESDVEAGKITRSMWYGRTWRLMRRLVGNGKGTGQRTKVGSDAVEATSEQ